jgi:glycosyltransferase involved in cell wall biosynthesis
VTVPPVSHTATTMSRAEPRPVVLFTNSMVMGGMEAHVLQLGRTLAQRGVRVGVICSLHAEIQPLREGLIEAGVTVHALAESGGSAGGVARRFSELVQTLKTYRGGVLHLHFTGFRGGDLVVAAARLAGIQTIVRSVHLPPVPPLGSLDRLLIRPRDALLSRVICVSEPTRQEHLKILGRDPARLTVVHNGIDLATFSPAVSGDGVHADLGLAPETPIIGTVSRLGEERKGVNYFVDMAATVLAEWPAARFLIVGDGSLRPDLERQAATLGIADRLIFTGERKDIPRLLAAMRVFVIPSLYEACQYSLLEAMAMGKAVVATPAGVAPVVVEDHRTGLLVPLADSAALARAVLEYRDASLVQRLGAAAHRLMVAQFSIDAMVDNILAVYTPHGLTKDRQGLVASAV